MENHNLNWWIGQIIGIVAFCITALGFFQKDEKKIKNTTDSQWFFFGWLIFGF